jgi:putative N6-adenine-specific DNA methylase
MERFFLVVPVNMERLALYELARHLSSWGIENPSYEFFPGGLEVQLPLETGLRLNSVLKIPVRILLRVIERETKTEEEFEKLVRDADLKRFSPLGDVHVASRSSFLRFKKSLEETVYDCVPYRPKHNGGDVFIRVFRDVCTISVNTSGEDLYRRGYDKWVGEAPVRDSIASALLQLLLKGIEIQTPLQIIDPMAGSGTFLIEAYNKDQPLNRTFIFEKWPQSSKIDKTATIEKPNWSLLANDQSKQHVEILKHNAEVAKVPMEITHEDLFKATKWARSGIPRIVISNPPYGKRLKTSGHKDYFHDVLKKIIQVYEPERVGLLTPREWLEHDGYEKMYMLDMENSGVETRFTVLYKN